MGIHAYGRYTGECWAYGVGLTQHINPNAHVPRDIIFLEGRKILSYTNVPLLHPS